MTEEEEFLSYDDYDINIPRLISNSIYNKHNSDLIYKLSSNWRRYLIKYLDRDFYKVDQNEDYWKTLMARYRNDLKEDISDMILEYDKKKKSEYFLILYSCESLLLTNMEYSDENIKTIKKKEVEINEFGIAFATKLVFIEPIKINGFLDFQLESNFDNNTLKFLTFLNSLLFEYEAKDNFLEVGQINALKHYIETMTKEKNGEIESSLAKPNNDYGHFEKRLEKDREYFEKREMDLIDKYEKKINELVLKNSLLLKDLKEENKDLKSKLIASENEISLDWLTKSVSAQSYFFKFLLNMYVSNEDLKNVNISKILNVILLNKPYTRDNQYIQKLRMSPAKDCKKEIGLPIKATSC